MKIPKNLRSVPQELIRIMEGSRISHELLIDPEKVKKRGGTSREKRAYRASKVFLIPNRLMCPIYQLNSANFVLRLISEIDVFELD